MRRHPSETRAWRLLLVAPLALFAVLFLLPQVAFVRTSVHENLGYGRFGDAITLANYARLVGEPLYRQALLRTVVVSLAVTAVCLVVGFPLAYALARSGRRWGGPLLGLLVASAFITAVVKDLGLIIVMSEGGALNRALRALSVVDRPVKLLGTDTGVVIGLVHYTLPLLVLVLHTMIRTIGRSVEEAAEIHGATRRRVLQRVVVPLALPGIVAAALMVFNLAMGAFTTPVLLGGGRVLTFPVLIQRTVILDVDYPFGASLSACLLVVVFALNLVATYLMARQRSRLAPVLRGA
jgi:putative spermidine/putrescine transport system permease protein